MQSENSVASVLSSGYIHVKEEISRFVPFKRGSKSGNAPFLFYSMPVANPMLPRGNHFIHHMLKRFSYFYPPSYRGRLCQISEADVGSCKVKLPTIIAITPLPLGRREKFWRQSFSARSNPMSRKRSVDSTSSCEVRNQVILSHLL